MEKENSKYIKGFNHAYLLAKYKPELIKSIATTKSQNEYVQGLKDGKDTFEQNKTKSRFQEIEKLRSQKEKNRGKDLER
jgi:hypothetical protein